MQLLSPEDLPPDWRYPAAFLRVVDRGIRDLQPWELLHGYVLSAINRSVRDRYPNRALVPFAKRTDSDDLACWDAGIPEVVHVIDYSEYDGREQLQTYPTFHSWFRAAIEDLIDFDSLEPPGMT